MVAQSMPFVPPAPKTHRGFVPLWRLVTTTDALKIWPDFAFEIDFNRRRVLGIDTFLLNDPEDIRHVLTANAANWRRPILMNRIARPLGGEGLFLAEGAAWRRQRRLLAPAFTPGAINRLVPHFQAAGEHQTLGLEGAATANLSLAFQDVALEAVLRSLFSMPENEARVKLSAMAAPISRVPATPTSSTSSPGTKVISPFSRAGAGVSSKTGSRRSRPSSRRAGRNIPLRRAGICWT
jgi:cytochrome P450